MIGGKKLFFLAAAAVVAACHHAAPARPALPRPLSTAVAAAPAPPPPPCDAAPDAERAIAACEEQALRSADPAAPLLAAARLHRQRMDRSDDPSIEAQACAADAHRSWSAHAATVEQVGAADAEALYLEAVCSAAWARAQGFTPLIERRGDLTAALTRVARLAPDLDGAGPDRELGALLAALPTYAGGDLAEARRHLEEAVKRAPKDARNRIVLARAAVKSQDRALFDEQLKAVPDSPDAQALLQREDDLFGR